MHPDTTIDVQITMLEARLVEYTLTSDESTSGDERRPALIVRRWNEDVVNLVVFMDGTHDGAQHASCVYWATHRVYDVGGAAGTWRRIGDSA